MAKQQETKVAGIVVAIVILVAVVSIGYFQFYVAPNVFNSSSSLSTSSTTASCSVVKCVNITIPLGAGTPQGAPGYSPDVVTVVIGVNNTIVWLNNDTAIHTVTANNSIFNSGNMNPGDMFIYTFTTPGTYSYRCIYHSWMVGKVIVKS